jgi:hypothetical protein
MPLAVGSAQQQYCRHAWLQGGIPYALMSFHQPLHTLTPRFVHTTPGRAVTKSATTSRMHFIAKQPPSTGTVMGSTFVQAMWATVHAAEQLHKGLN